MCNHVGTANCAECATKLKDVSHRIAHLIDEITHSDMRPVAKPAGVGALQAATTVQAAIGGVRRKYEQRNIYKMEKMTNVT